MGRKSTPTIKERLHLYNMHLAWLNQPLRTHEQVKIDRTIMENDLEEVLKTKDNDPCWRVFKRLCEILTIDDERWEALDQTYPYYKTPRAKSLMAFLGRFQKQLQSEKEDCLKMSKKLNDPNQILSKQEDRSKSEDKKRTIDLLIKPSSPKPYDLKSIPVPE